MTNELGNSTENQTPNALEQVVNFWRKGNQYLSTTLLGEHRSHNNSGAAWLTVGPNVLYCLSIITLCIFMSMFQGDDDFDEVFFTAMYSAGGVFVWLFSSFLITLLSVIVAFIKKSPPMWMIIGPGLGFAISLVLNVIFIGLIWEGVDLFEALDDLFLEVNGFVMILVGFFVHAGLAFATIRMMIVATRNENN